MSFSTKGGIENIHRKASSLDTLRPVKHSIQQPEQKSVSARGAALVGKQQLRGGRAQRGHRVHQRLDELIDPHLRVSNDSTLTHHIGRDDEIKRDCTQGGRARLRPVERDSHHVVRWS